ncbi:MAG: ChbG/HpnK family deacetylase [Desulfomonilia bacterium]|nr:ChbG/HpnK family deacetylase [Desulfomonilia bacterium]
MNPSCIVHADDLGISPEVNRGVLEGLTSGVITDTSILVDAPWAGEAARLLMGFGCTHAGIHLNLDELFGWSSPGRERISRDELMSRFGRGEFLEVCRSEARRQIEQFLSLELSPSHLDTHHHVHGFGAIFFLLLDLMKDYHIEAMRFSRQGYRLLTRDAIPYDRLLYELMEANLREHGIVYCDTVLEGVDALARIGPGTTELIVHPARGGDAWRERELDILLSPTFAELIRERQVYLTNYQELTLSAGTS